MKLRVTVEQEFERLSEKSVRLFTERIQAMVIAEKSGDPRAKQRAASQLADLIRRTQALADLLGRKKLFEEMDVALARVPPGAVAAISRRFAARFAAGAVPAPDPGVPTPILPDVPFSEAVRDLIRREPRLAPNAELVAEVYSRVHGFALARSASEKVTEAVQRVITNILTEKVPPEEIQRGLDLDRVRLDGIEAIRDQALLQQTEPFARSYAEVVYRTNLNTAFTAGRFQQASDEDVAEVMPAFEYVAIDDALVRRGRPEDNGENHLAIDGAIAATESKTWQTFSPPSGYSCRCSLRLVSVFELKRRGIITNLTDPIPEPSGLDPSWVHPNFRRGRPDHAIYFGIQSR